MTKNLAPQTQAFSRYSALGNDYLVIDPLKFSLNLNSLNIRKICHRHFGLGSDGILFGPIFEPQSQSQPQSKISLRIFNPDGSEAEKSGNGLRIFARYLLDFHYVQGHGHPLTISTKGGEVRVEYPEDKNGPIKVHMGKRIFESEKIPVNSQLPQTLNFPLTLQGKEWKISCVSMGNPHCVLPLPKEVSLSSQLVQTLGPEIEHHALFPQRTNVQLLKVLSRNKIQIEIWERGAGYTLASGSSSCAAASVAHQLKLVDEEITVCMPGGEIAISLEKDGGVWMTGAVTAIAHGFFAEQFTNELQRPSCNEPGSLNL